MGAPCFEGTLSDLRVGRKGIQQENHRLGRPLVSQISKEVCLCLEGPRKPLKNHWFEASPGTHIQTPALHDPLKRLVKVVVLTGPKWPKCMLGPTVPLN